MPQFDYRAGDVAYFPKSNSHYIENVGTEDLIFLEVLQADRFSGENGTSIALILSLELLLNVHLDIALGQWLALTPPQILVDTLHLSLDTISKFKKEKQYIVTGAPTSNATSS